MPFVCSLAVAVATRGRGRLGATDAGSSISYAQMVLDDEIIAGLRRMMQGITLHDLDEEVALIKANTPRGNFLRAKHTRRTFREHWLPGILNRDTYETWQAKGETIEQAVEDLLNSMQGFADFMIVVLVAAALVAGLVGEPGQG